MVNLHDRRIAHNNSCTMADSAKPFLKHDQLNFNHRLITQTHLHFLHDWSIAQNFSCTISRLRKPILARSVDPHKAFPARSADRAKNTSSAIGPSRKDKMYVVQSTDCCAIERLLHDQTIAARPIDLSSAQRDRRRLSDRAQHLFINNQQTKKL